MKGDCMIGFFTDPFPDEVLYSACARYHKKAGYKSKSTTSRSLFGKGTIKVVVDFPTRLGYLAAQLPSNTYSVDLLIDKYTLLPPFLSFTSVKQAEILRRHMEGEGGGAIYGQIGILTSGIKLHHLRFCLGCVADDEARFRQPYWHRIHQVPGVEVCPTHSVFLSESKVPMRTSSGYQGLVTARQGLANLSANRKPPRALDASNHTDGILLRLALGMASLLQTRFESDPERIRRRYATLLFEHELATFAGKVRQAQLTARFLNYYPSELLTQLGCELKGSTGNWLNRLVQGGTSVHHPLHHLLLINFLGSTPEKFFQLTGEIHPFGCGPWPCLNRAVTHFLELRIAKCQIAKEQRTPKIMGTFTCDCGFSYRRVGFDKNENRRFEFDRIKSLGNAWYAKLRELLSAGYNRPQMASILGVPKNTIVHEIARVRRARRSNSQIVPRFATLIIDPSKSRNSLRAKHRDDWRKALANHDPADGRCGLRAKVLAAYSWLTVNDKIWLKENLPPTAPLGPKEKKDWSVQDRAFPVEVHRIAEEMRSAPGPPVRVSQAAIAKRLDIFNPVFTSYSLPQTKSALVEAAETCEAFTVRRIRWVRECFLREASTPVIWRKWWWQHISPSMKDNEIIRAEWQQCIQALMRHYNLP